MARSDPQINIRLPQELKDRLTEKAEANKRSVNAEAVAAIEFALSNAESSSDNSEIANLKSLISFQENLKIISELEQTLRSTLDHIQKK